MSKWNQSLIGPFRKWSFSEAMKDWGETCVKPWLILLGLPLQENDFLQGAFGSWEIYILDFRDIRWLLIDGVFLVKTGIAFFHAHPQFFSGNLFSWLRSDKVVFRYGQTYVTEKHLYAKFKFC